MIKCGKFGKRIDSIDRDRSIDRSIERLGGRSTGRTFDSTLHLLLLVLIDYQYHSTATVPPDSGCPLRRLQSSNQPTNQPINQSTNQLINRVNYRSTVLTSSSLDIMVIVLTD
mmetsp:Transcript_15861/g.29938  ORF Transcript_15861/g.29938 Transcript_15861/m.29938 type:complete len:113 (-) Transcript_15861:14-352(-)